MIAKPSVKPITEPWWWDITLAYLRAIECVVRAKVARAEAPTTRDKCDCPLVTVEHDLGNIHVADVNHPDDNACLGIPNNKATFARKFPGYRDEYEYEYGTAWVLSHAVGTGQQASIG